MTTPAIEPAGPTARSMRAFKIVALVTVLAFVALVAWALWVASRPEQSAPAPRFDRFEPAWTSAMSKAGVEATFPAGPVELKQLRAKGRRSLEATFTAEEISALVNVYRYTAKISGAEVALSSVGIDFPQPGRVALSGSLVTGGSGYAAEAAAPATYSSGRIRSGGLSSLTVEGFSVRGDRRQQAGDALLTYFNKYLDAAPGLTVESAEIVDGGVVIRGFAPTGLVNPAE